MLRRPRLSRRLASSPLKLNLPGNDVSCRDRNTQVRVDQKVGFRPDLGEVADRKRPLLSWANCPENGGVFQYQIKSEIDDHARLVRENSSPICEPRRSRGL